MLYNLTFSFENFQWLLFAYWIKFTPVIGIYLSTSFPIISLNVSYHSAKLIWPFTRKKYIIIIIIIIFWVPVCTQSLQKAGGCRSHPVKEEMASVVVMNVVYKYCFSFRAHWIYTPWSLWSPAWSHELLWPMRCGQTWHVSYPSRSCASYPPAFFPPLPRVRVLAFTMLWTYRINEKKKCSKGHEFIAPLVNLEFFFGIKGFLLILKRNPVIETSDLGATTA